MESFSTGFFKETYASSTTEAHIALPFYVMGWTIAAATQAARVRFGRPLVIPMSEMQMYFYDSSGGTLTALAEPTIAAPWTLNSLKAADRIYVCAKHDLISDLEITVGNTNSSGASLQVGYATTGGGYISQPLGVTWANLTITDGTDVSGNTLGQNGRVQLEGLPVQKINTLAPEMLVGGVWYRLKVSAGLDASVTITGLTVLAPHIYVAAAGSEYDSTGSGSVNNMYFRTDSSAGTVVLKGSV